MKIATIDIGTNSLRLLLAEVREKCLRIVDSRLATTRLGKGITDGIINFEAIDRTLSSLAEFEKLISDFAPEKVWIVATSAVRDATNRQSLIDRIKKELRLQVDVISGQQEALLGYLGVTAGLVTCSGTYVLDIGGGSTELITAIDDSIYAKSLQLGAVRMTEGGYTEEEIGNLISTGFSDLPVPPQVLIGVGGTATTLAAVAQGMEVYQPSAIHGYVLNKGQVDGLYEHLQALSLAERRRVPGLQPQRADIIVAGVMILKSVMEHLSISYITISEADLLVGLPRYYGLEIESIDFTA